MSVCNKGPSPAVIWGPSGPLRSTELHIHGTVTPFIPPFSKHSKNRAHLMNVAHSTDISHGHLKKKNVWRFIHIHVHVAWQQCVDLCISYVLKLTVPPWDLFCLNIWWNVLLLMCLSRESDRKECVFTCEYVSVFECLCVWGGACLPACLLACLCVRVYVRVYVRVCGLEWLHGLHSYRAFLTSAAGQCLTFIHSNSHS